MEFKHSDRDAAISSDQSELRKKNESDFLLYSAQWMLKLVKREIPKMSTNDMKYVVGKLDKMNAENRTIIAELKASPDTAARPKVTHPATAAASESRSNSVDVPVDAQLLTSVRDNPRNIMALSENQHWALWTSTQGLALFKELTGSDAFEFEHEIEHAIKVMDTLSKRYKIADDQTGELPSP